MLICAASAIRPRTQRFEFEVSLNDKSRNEPEESAKRQSSWTWIIPIALLAILVGLYFIWPAYEGFVEDGYAALASGSQDRVQEWVSGFGGWSFAVLIALMLMQTVLAFLPSLLIMVVAVLAFGPILGGLLAWGGLLLAACLGYGIGYSVGQVTVDRLLGHQTEQKMERLVDRYGIWAIIAARISPVMSTDAVSMIAGLASMRFLPFVLATAIGTLPLTALVSWLGADVERLQTGLVWIAVISAATFVGYVVYDRRKHGGT